MYCFMPPSVTQQMIHLSLNAKQKIFAVTQFVICHNTYTNSIVFAFVRLLAAQVSKQCTMTSVKPVSVEYLHYSIAWVANVEVQIEALVDICEVFQQNQTLLACREKGDNGKSKNKYLLEKNLSSFFDMR